MHLSSIDNINLNIHCIDTISYAQFHTMLWYYVNIALLLIRISLPHLAHLGISDYREIVTPPLGTHQPSHLPVQSQTFDIQIFVSKCFRGKTYCRGYYLLVVKTNLGFKILRDQKFGGKNLFWFKCFG